MEKQKNILSMLMEALVIVKDIMLIVRNKVYGKDMIAKEIFVLNNFISIMKEMGHTNNILKPEH